MGAINAAVLSRKFALFPLLAVFVASCSEPLPPGDPQLALNAPRTPQRLAMPSPPDRFTVAGRTMEVLAGGGHSMNVIVPVDGKFETGLALTDGLERARFIVRAHTNVGAEVFVRETEIEATNVPAWNNLSINLSTAAGLEIDVSLDVETDNEDTTAGALWGAPKVWSTSGESEATPVILISCDTLRADHVSLHGYERQTTPNLEVFAKDAVVFENAFSPVSWTLQAHLSMFTGLHPMTHHGSVDANLPEDVTTLAEALRAKGYHTAGFTGFRGWLMPTQGFAQGFDVYETPPKMVRNIDAVHESAMQWLDNHATPNLFLFLHNYDAHALFDAGTRAEPMHRDVRDFSFTHSLMAEPETDADELAQVRSQRRLDEAGRGQRDLSENDIALNIAYYDDSIRIVDSRLGEVFQHLRELNLYEDALIVVTSDHGEGLGAHDSYGHNQVYDEQLHVPLIVKFPGQKYAGSRIGNFVTLMDIAPTILDITNTAMPGDLDGTTLVPLLESPEELFPERDLFVMRLLWRGLRTTEWKILDQSGMNRTELYQIAQDPDEAQDLVDEHPEVARSMMERLEDFFAPPAFGWLFDIRQPEPAEEAARLVVSTTGRFNRSWMQRPLFWSSELLDTQQAVQTFEADLKGVTRKTARLFPEGGDGRLSLNLMSDSSWTIVADGQKYDGSVHSLVLDPQKNMTPLAEAELAESVDSPTIHIWFVPREGESTAAGPMSDEDRAALEALGYVN